MIETGEDCFSWWGRKEINADRMNELMVCVCVSSVPDAEKLRVFVPVI